MTPTPPKKTGGQVTLTQMLKALDKDVASGIEKKLKKLSKKQALKKPLDKNVADQIERKAAYSAVTKDISKWEPIVDQHRRAKQIKFPLDQEPDVLPSTAESLSELIPRNALEEEVLNVISTSKTALRDNKELSKAEEKYLKAISVDEAQERHRELQKMRVLLSSFAAKMRRQKLIKSKSYHRLLKRERIRKHVRKVESDKDLLKEELDRLQRLRAQERASLKHKNTGKWAKHAKFRAKYDDDARKAMLEQIGLAERLLERPAEDDSEDSDDDDAASDISMESDNEEDDESEEEITTVVKKDAEPVLAKVNVGDDDSEDDDDDDDNEEEEDYQRKLMSEAFADDDVVAEFQRNKEELAGEEQPKDVDKFLPGWGGWAGPGIRISKRKRAKYIVKAKKLPRRDDKLGNVIISEQADNKIKGKMVKKLPRGVKNKAEMEKRLTQPTAATFVGQKQHRDSVRPRIETKMGARIEPMRQRGGKKAKWA